MSDGIDYFLHRKCVEKIYGAPSDRYPQNAMTMAHVADRLLEYLTPQSLWVEWSTNLCDYARVFQALKKLGRAWIMPPISNVFRLNLAWRFGLTDFDVSCRLSVLYRMIGRYGTELSSLAHRAEPDVRMMYELAVTYFRGTLQPAQRTQITHYMTFTCKDDFTKRSSRPQRISSRLNGLGHKNKEDLKSSDEDRQMNGHREVDANFNEEEQLATEEWRLTMAQGLAIQDDKDLEVEVDLEYYDDCNAYDEMMMIDSME
jgi:hypothetical protein